MKIRQEINIIDTYMVATSGSFATSSAIVLLDTTEYVSPTYYFEVVASTSATLATEVYLRTTTGIGRATTTVPLGTTAYRVLRSSAFTPPTGSTEFVVTINNTAGANKGIIAARIIVIDNASDMTSTETQIEIGNQETAKTNTTSSALTSPKYWKYNSSKWDGTVTFAAEVSYQNTQTSSTTLYTTATTTTRSATYIGSPGVTYVQVEAWGAGGGGSIANAGGGGGGGGAYARSTTTVTAGTSHTLSIPAGGVTDTAASAGDATYDTNVVIADGGIGTADNTAGAGGNLTNTVGQVEFVGGSGGAGNTSGDVGGGGGGAAGPHGAGATVLTSAANVPNPGGQGDNGNGGAGGAAGTGDGASCPTSAGKPGINNTNGGGGGGGADGNATNTCTGGTGGYPGGGGGSSELAGATQAGGAGQMRLMETHGAVGIAIEEDNGSFTGWTFKAQIVSAGVATSTPSLVRSATFTPTDARHYRLVASTTHASAPYSIYNAKIIVDQSGTITKLEPQYLLANTSFNTVTGLKDFDTTFDPGEWTGVTNVYIHEANGAASGTGDVKLQSDPNGAPADIAGSDITNVIEVEQGSSNLTMPVLSATIDVNVTGTGTLNASRIIVQVAVAVAPEAVKITSAQNQRFRIGQTDTDISPITVIDGTTAEITLANDILIAIATTTGVMMEWDTSITTATIGGSASGKVSTTVSYSGTSILVIDVTSDFSASESIVISGLQYKNFASPEISTIDAITLHTDGSTAGSAAAGTPQLITIDDGRVFKIGKPPNYLSLNNGLISYYTFDGRNMYNNVADISGQSNNGFLNGQTSTTTIVGRIGQAVDFSDSDDYVNIGDMTTLETEDTATWAFWVKPNAFSGISFCYICKGNPNGETQMAWTILEGSTGFNGADEIQVKIPTVNTDILTLGGTDNSVLAVGMWTHVTVVFDGTLTGNDNRLKVYTNGVQQTLTFVDTIPATLLASTALARIADASDDSRNVNAVMDEVRIYNRALTAAEVLNLSKVGSTRISKSPDPGNLSGLLAHWTFDGKDMYTRVADVSGQGTHGFLNGQTSTTTAIGKVGQAIDFSDSDDYVNIGDMTALEGEDTATWSFWVKPNAFSGISYCFICKGNPNGETQMAWNILEGSTGFNGADELQVKIPTINTDILTLGGTDASVLAVGRWTHVAVVFDGTLSGNDNRLKIYTDGVQQTLSFVDTIPATLLASTALARIADASDDSRNVNAIIDDVRIYNRAMTAKEVLQLYYLGTSKIEP